MENRPARLVALGRVGIDVVEHVAVGPDYGAPVGGVLPAVHFGKVVEAGCFEGAGKAEDIDDVRLGRAFVALDALHRIEVVGIGLQTAYGDRSVCGLQPFYQIVACLDHSAVGDGYVVDGGGAVHVGSLVGVGDFEPDAPHGNFAAILYDAAGRVVDGRGFAQQAPPVAVVTVGSYGAVAVGILDPERKP